IGSIVAGDSYSQPLRHQPGFNLLDFHFLVPIGHAAKYRDDPVLGEKELSSLGTLMRAVQ
ncbi:MAG: hypothetical protein J4N63_04755, partial [Chloroflexi bacterium]|nr:hypothetical protein [Chloroflexota bacterium]